MNNRYVKINDQAIRDKISGIYINELIISNEIGNPTKENNSACDLNYQQSTFIRNLTKDQISLINNNNYRNNDFQSIKPLNDFNIDSVINFKNTDIKSDSKFLEKKDDNNLRQKIECMQNKIFNNFEDKEKNYLEIIQILLKTIQETKEVKASKTTNANNLNPSKGNL